MSGESSNSGGESPSYQRRTPSYQRRSSGESPNESSESPTERITPKKTTTITQPKKKPLDRDARKQAYIKATTKT